MRRYSLLVQFYRLYERQRERVLKRTLVCCSSLIATQSELTARLRQVSLPTATAGYSSPRWLHCFFSLCSAEAAEQRTIPKHGRSMSFLHVRDANSINPDCTPMLFPHAFGGNPEKGSACDFPNFSHYSPSNFRRNFSNESGIRKSHLESTPKYFFSNGIAEAMSSFVLRIATLS